MLDEETISKYQQVWNSIEKLCESFTEQEWKMPTECPGWTTQDNVAHIVDFESRLLGRQVPDHVPVKRPHTKNDLGQRNEIWIDWFRLQPGALVLEAFREVTAERLRILPQLSDEVLNSPSPISTSSELLGSHLQRRIVDCWAHEQDIRRAVSRPGHVDGPVVSHIMERLLGGFGAIVARRAQAPSGSTIALVLNGPYRHTLVLRVNGDRADPCEPLPDLPTVRLTMDSETFACLCFGRWDSDTVLESGRVLVAGDRTLGYEIVRHMCVTP